MSERRKSWNMKDFRRALKDTQFTEMENMVRAATSNDEVGADQELLRAIARYTSRTNYYELSNIMWKRINDLSYPKHVLKGLELCYYLLRDARLQRQIAIDCNLRVGVLEKLLHYYFPKGKFKGTPVRDEAKKILKLLEEINKKAADEKQRGEKGGKTPAPAPAPAPAPVVKKKKKPRSRKPSTDTTGKEPKKELAPPQPEEEYDDPFPAEPAEMLAPQPASELLFEDLPVDDVFGDSVPAFSPFFPPKVEAKVDTPKKEERKQEPTPPKPADAFDNLLGSAFGSGFKSLPTSKTEEPVDEEELNRKAREERLRKAREKQDQKKEKERLELEEREAKEKQSKEESLRRAQEARRSQKEKEQREKEQKERDEREARERETREKLAREQEEKLLTEQKRQQEERERQEQERQRLEREHLAIANAARLEKEALERQLAEMRREKELMEKTMRERDEREKLDRGAREQRDRELEEVRKESERLAQEIKQREASVKLEKAELERLERERQEQFARAAEQDRLIREKLQKEAEDRVEREKQELALALERERAERERLTQAMKENQERSEAERKEREAKDVALRLAREEQERLEKERLEKLERERKSSTKYVDDSLSQELAAYAQYFNTCLAKDDSGALAHLLPIRTDSEKNSGLDLLLKVRDGLLLALFINYIVADTIDLRVLNKPVGSGDEGKSDGVSPSGGLTELECLENLNLVINASKAIGVRTKTTSEELLDATGSKQRVVATTDFIWELIRHQLLQELNLGKHPELVVLSQASDGDDTQERMLLLNRLPGEEMVHRWAHHHLKDTQSGRNPKDLPDVSGYVILIHKLLAFIGAPKPSIESFGEAVKQLGVKFVVPETHLSHGRLNLALCASIFHQSTGLDLKKDQAESERLKKELDMLAKMSLENSGKGEVGEQAAFTLWINSLNLLVEIGKHAKRRGGLLDEGHTDETREVFVYDLFHDLRDGLFLLRIIDHIKPGSVNWSAVEMMPNSRFKKISNCNRAVELCQELKLVLVGVGGVDIADGNSKLTLALIWQLMRLHMIEFLKQLKSKAAEKKAKAKEKELDVPESESKVRRASVDMAKVDADFDALIIDWANKMVKLNECVNGKKALTDAERKNIRHATGYRDQSLADSLFFLDLLYAVSPRVVDWRFVAKVDPGTGRKLALKDGILNARYCISAARKLGCTIFLLPEDIVSLKPKMLLTLIASIMTVAIS